MMRGVKAARTLVRRFARSSRGNVAMLFAISLPVLVMITMGGVDISRAATVRVSLQDALDAATLAAARSSAATNADLTTVGTKALQANLQAYPNITLASATFSLNSNQVVIADAQVSVKTLVANIVLPPYGKLLDDYLPVDAHSEVNRSSKNIEVGLVVDITGSMGSNNRLTDLKAAANQLVDIVVQSQQTPYYTRMAVIPYSIGVNLGSYADGARGTPATSVNITAASWASGVGKVITGISKANPAVVTSVAHGFATGDSVWITGITASGSGTKMSTLNDIPYKVTKINANTFSLQTLSGTNVNTSSFASWSSGGTVTKCQVSDCSIVITALNHGLAATTTDTGSTRPNTVYITNVSGLTVGGVSLVNNLGFEIGNVTTNSFSIGITAGNATAYGAGGQAWCGSDGCKYRVFRRWSDNALTTVLNTTCVSERIGAQAYTDASPVGAKVGRNYAATANPCPTPVIQPLTSNKTTLNSVINSLAATGSTGAQVGLAWGWYTVSPNFNSLWSSNPAGVYSVANTLKAVILMTDGDFNSPYCTGVIAQDAINPGSGASADKITCNATNGDSYSQATTLCAAMKAQNIVVYTVGFTVVAGSAGAQVLQNCATGPTYAFLPASGADLSDDFAAIGRDITRLKISK